MTPALGYLLWDTALVALSSHTTLLAAPPCVFALGGAPMSCHVFQYFSIVVIHGNFTRVYPGAERWSVVHLCWRVGPADLGCLARAASEQ